MTKKNSLPRNKIVIRGARVNNLKNVDIDIPRDKLVVVTGLSGSGKSSLAFDVVYAEGNRRYLEGISSYARQFLDVGAKPDVDKIENLSPAISIDQKSIGRSPRSTVGTLTEIYDYLRVLFAKIGLPHCPSCGAEMQKKNVKEILEEILVLPENSTVIILAKIKDEGKKSKEALKNISQLGYARVRFDGKIVLVSEAMEIVGEQMICPVEVVVDRISIRRKNPDKERIVDSIETAFKLGGGSCTVAVENEADKFFNQDFVCHKCQIRIMEITPRHFSFNNPEGACTHCSGLGITKEVDVDLVVPNKNLSLAEGAILPWSKSNGRGGGSVGYLQILEVLGKEYGFSVNVPVKKLSENAMNIIFYGPEKKEILIEQKDDMGGTKEIRMNFEGVVPAIKRKYQEAASDYARSELEKYMLDKKCPLCQGKRLRPEYLSVRIEEMSIDKIVEMDLDNLVLFWKELKKKISKNKQKEIIADPLIQEMILKTEALINVGLGYLSLNRGANTISGGEAQRIRLATQIGSELMGITYVLDEPSIGLHSRDTEKLIDTMQCLKDGGNSLLVVEHDEDIIKKADWIIDMGPGAGEEGGQVIFQGDIKKLMQSKTATAHYLSGKKKVAEKKSYRKGNGKQIEIIGAKENNLKNIDVVIPLGKFVAITGVSGSGKSTLVSSILSKALAKYFFGSKENPGEHKKIKGLNLIDKVISINQAPIGRTPRSNAATYTGVFSLIRELFASTEESKNNRYTSSRFSFNMKGGRCEICQGEGIKKIEMHLLPDMFIKCEACSGTRYNKKTLDIEYQGVNIAEVLDMSVGYALNFFKKNPLIWEKLHTLEQVGLGYLKLGQSAISLSGGEAQRIKLATELSRKSTGKTLYILDEPTIGLHFDDVKRLLGVLDALVNRGNSVLVVEHNMDVIRNADWVIDLGPEGGSRGGEIVYAGTPDKLKKEKRSWTAKYL